jgi:cytochrome c-type biogenesis protein CcmH/NrfG
MGLEAAGEFREAEAEFQSALRLQPSNQEAQQGIRRVVVRLSHSRRP